MSVVNGNRYYVIASYYGSKTHGKNLRYLEGYNELIPEGFLSDQRSDNNNENYTPVSRNDTDDRVTIKVPKVPKTGDKNRCCIRRWKDNSQDKKENEETYGEK